MNDINTIPHSIDPDAVHAAEKPIRKFAVLVLLVATAAVFIFFFGSVREQAITLPYENPRALGTVTEVKNGVIFAERLDLSVAPQPVLLEVLTDADTVFVRVPAVLNLAGVPAQRIELSAIAVGDRVYVYDAPRSSEDSAAAPEWLLSFEESVKTRRERIKAAYVAVIREESGK